MIIPNQEKCFCTPNIGPFHLLHCLQPEKTKAVKSKQLSEHLPVQSQH